MMLRKWEDLPQEMRTEEVRPYYDLLRRKQGSLLCKRLFDILASLVLLVLLSPVFLVLAIAIKLDSHGPVFYRQVRVTQYGREFRIFKFRTMVQNADRIGSQVTVSGELAWLLMQARSRTPSQEERALLDPFMQLLTTRKTIRETENYNE